MRALILSMGSLGRRHADVLRSLGFDISAISSQKIIDIKCYKELETVDINQFDYFIIASPTYLHFKHLLFL